MLFSIFSLFIFSILVLPRGPLFGHCHFSMHTCLHVENCVNNQCYFFLDNLKILSHGKTQGRLFYQIVQFCMKFSTNILGGEVFVLFLDPNRLEPQKLKLSKVYSKLPCTPVQCKHTCDVQVDVHQVHKKKNVEWESKAHPGGRRVRS